VSSHEGAVAISIYTKAKPDVPIANVSIHVKSPDLLEEKDQLPEKSKLRMFTRETFQKDVGAKTEWFVREEKNARKLAPEQYLEYSIYYYLHSIMKAANLAIARLLAEIAVQLSSGGIDSVREWFPEDVVYNGIYLRNGENIYNIPKLLETWNPSDAKCCWKPGIPATQNGTNITRNS
jgi:hypothetical protein